MPTARVNGIDLHYELDGPERAPLVVFSNSLGATARMWDGVVAHLSNRFRCLRYDTRGHGRSGSSDAEISIDDLAADLKGLLDAVGVARAHVVGLSLGGMTAQAFALNNPGAVASLTLIATAAHLPTRDFWNQRAALVRREGYDIGYVDVVDRPRQYGRSNYGMWDRLWVGILDLCGVWWLIRRRKRVPEVSEV